MLRDGMLPVLTLTRESCPFATIADRRTLKVPSGACFFKLNNTVEISSFIYNDAKTEHMVTFSEDSSYYLIHFNNETEGTYNFLIIY